MSDLPWSPRLETYMRRTLPFLLALLALPAHAVDVMSDNKPSPFEYDFDANTKAWSELQNLLPPYPRRENFVAISLGNRSSNRFYVDYNSVSADLDGVVRYGVVVESPSGAQTVSFEGMRCETGERKIYAFGHPGKDGGSTWQRNRYARWEAIQGRTLNDIRSELYRHYFCTVNGTARLADIQYRLKSGGEYGN